MMSVFFQLIKFIDQTFSSVEKAGKMLSWQRGLLLLRLIYLLGWTYWKKFPNSTKYRKWSETICRNTVCTYYISRVFIIRKSTFSQRVTVNKHQISPHKQSEKAIMCFYTRRTSACNFTVLQSHFVFLTYQSDFK